MSRYKRYGDYDERKQKPHRRQRAVSVVRGTLSSARNFSYSACFHIKEMSDILKRTDFVIFIQRKHSELIGEQRRQSDGEKSYYRRKNGGYRDVYKFLREECLNEDFISDSINS